MQDGPFKTILVATLLCLVCSLLVSYASVRLRPLQEKNAKLDFQKKLLITAKLIDPNTLTTKDQVQNIFKEKVVIKTVDLKTGEEVQVSEDELQKEESIFPEQDLAKIKTRSRYSKVYWILENGELDQIILPVRGKGLWSTLYGLLALDRNMRTIKGLEFYKHGETPGLGGEVDNPKWKAQWKDKLAFEKIDKMNLGGSDSNFSDKNTDRHMQAMRKPEPDKPGKETESGGTDKSRVSSDGFIPTVAIQVLKGRVNPDDPKRNFKVDGLTGATITSQGVQSLLHYWLGQDALGPYIQNLRSQQESRP